jgi:hypothetical protein
VGRKRNDKKRRGEREAKPQMLRVSKRGLRPLFFKKIFPLSTLGEGDQGGEVDKYSKK